MISQNSDFLPKPPHETLPQPPLKVPPLASLQHRIEHAKDANGQLIPLRDELLFFLDDPPPGTHDRWQAGADLCQGHGISTSRMSVWRYYRAHILAWRRQQLPAPPVETPSPEETARLHDQARHLAAQRVLETLNDPRLSPTHLIGLIQNDNHRQHIQLRRDQFNDRLNVRRGQEQRDHYQRLDNQVRNERLIPALMQFYRTVLSTLLGISPHTTP
jgi:hypothetical protein